MPAQHEAAIPHRVDGFQKFKKFLVAECGGFPEMSGKRPETPGDARNDTRKIGNFSDEFLGTSGSFSAELGLNPDSYDSQLSPSFEILKIGQDLKK